MINDGQHRSAAIAAALREKILRLVGTRFGSSLSYGRSSERLQQMFTDLNRYAHKTSKSLDVLYDHRDNLSALTMDISEDVHVFKGMVDKEKITIPMRSPKIFTLSTLYDANEELIGDKADKRGTKDYEQKRRLAVEYWTLLSKVVVDWAKVRGRLKGPRTAPGKNQHACGRHARPRWRGTSLDRGSSARLATALNPTRRSRLAKIGWLKSEPFVGQRLHHGGVSCVKSSHAFKPSQCSRTFLD